MLENKIEINQKVAKFIKIQQDFEIKSPTLHMMEI